MSLSSLSSTFLSPQISLFSIAVVRLAATIVAGLVVVARCAWICRFTGAAGDSSPPPARKGLKKKALESIPRFTFSAELHFASTTDCAICLTGFVHGEKIRVLSLCGHAFHVACIDRWLASRSSCASCRRIQVPVRCDRCSHIPAAEAEREICCEREREGLRERFAATWITD